MLALPALECSEWPVVYGLPGVGSVLCRKGGLTWVRVGSALIGLELETMPL